MKVVILAGGLPSTIADEAGIPKPMLEIGERPLLWHIMKLYSYYGCHDFIICAGYNSDLIKRYFMDYYIYQSDITIDLQTNQIEVHRKRTENWNVTVVDTGISTPAFERILAIRKYIHEDPFIVAYGDCISNLQISNMTERFNSTDKLAVAAVAKPAGRHQLLTISEDGDNQERADAWVDACNMVFSPKIFNYLGLESTQAALFEKLAEEHQITMYQHPGFWRTVETMRDRVEMEAMWQSGHPPWKVWND